MINPSKIKEKIKKHNSLKKLIFWILIPSNQAKPRFWVRWLVAPHFSKKGRNSVIRRRTRMDLFPFNQFILGENSIIEDFCTVNNGVGKVQIGNNTRVGIGSVIIGPVIIGDDVRLAQNVVLSGLNHNYQDTQTPISMQGVETDQIYIGDETWIGSNSVILPGVFIGKHCVVAAGSIVTKSIPSNCVAAGNPARVVKQYSQASGKWEKVTL